MVAVHGRARFAFCAFVAALGTACSSGGASASGTAGATNAGPTCTEAPRTTACNGACVDTNSDGSNCGTCGIVCQDERHCVMGDCTCPIAECSGACVDTQSDSAHCGACNTPCPSGVACSSGHCGVDREWAAWPMPNPADAGLPNPASYDTTMAGVVLDHVTGLLWQEPAPDFHNWADAHTYCAALTIAGGGFRMPTRTELVSLVDYTRSSPAIDVAAFPSTAAEGYWTATQSGNSPNAAWGIDFSDGSSGGKVDKSSVAHVRCVR